MKAFLVIRFVCYCLVWDAINVLFLDLAVTKTLISSVRGHDKKLLVHLV
jgi:hypothetical protein